jgi:hypothetical protein
MKDLTPILWIAGGIALYYAYQNNWFGTFTVTVPAAIPPVTSTPNLIPIATLTPPAPAPVVTPPVAAPVIWSPINGTPVIGNGGAPILFPPIYRTPVMGNGGAPILFITGGPCVGCQ